MDHPVVAGIHSSSTPTDSRVSAELPLSQKSAGFPDPINNPRPGYYGPLLPTTSPSAAAVLANAYLNHTAARAANIFPHFFGGRPPPPLLVNGNSVPLFPPAFSPAEIMTSSPSSRSPVSGKSIRQQGANAVCRTPAKDPPKGQEEESGSLLTVPSIEKEGWCRNKKYIKKVPNGYMCTVCSKTYGRYNSVSYHVTIYHRNPPIRCDEPQCQFTTREARYIHFHKYYRHGTPLPKSIDLNTRSCPFCRHVAKSPAMLDKHVNRHMPDCVKVGKGYKCNQCSMDLATQSEMVKHMWSHSQEEKKLLRCDQCSYKGKSESSLHQHKLFKHSSDMFKRNHICELCGYSAPTEHNLDAHKHLVHVHGGEENTQQENCRNLSSDPVGGIPDPSPGFLENGFRLSSENGSLDLSVDTMEESPKPPPPSCASSSSRSSGPDSENTPEQQEEREAADAGKLTPSNSSSELDDSHSKLASEGTTGYHSMVDYGTL